MVMLLGTVNGSLLHSVVGDGGGDFIEFLPDRLIRCGDRLAAGGCARVCLSRWRSRDAASVMAASTDAKCPLYTAACIELSMSGDKNE